MNEKCQTQKKITEIEIDDIKLVMKNVLNSMKIFGVWVHIDDEKLKMIKRRNGGVYTRINFLVQKSNVQGFTDFLCQRIVIYLFCFSNVYFGSTYTHLTSTNNKRKYKIVAWKISSWKMSLTNFICDSINLRHTLARTLSLPCNIF